MTREERQVVEKQLKKILNTMDVPLWKKQVDNQHNLFWLIRNLGIRNSDHKDFNEAIEIIKSLVGGGKP